MSKMSDLKYMLHMLGSAIDDMVDVEGDYTKSNCENAFATVESQVDNIESSLDSISYDIKELV